MRALALALLFLPLAGAPAALAGPMPVLPDLPPLPTEYDNVGQDGFYAGVLAGYHAGAAMEDGLEAGVVLGNTVAAADLLLGGEILAFADIDGGGSVEAALRVGLPLTGEIGIFGNLGLGHDFDTDAFAAIGVSAEAEIGGGWLWRADYRLNIDLTDEPASHRVFTGIVKRF